MRAWPLIGLLVACSGGVEEPPGPPLCDGPPLVCPEPIEAACTGPETPVAMADPVVCDRVALTTDGRLDAWPLGTTPVAFRATFSAGANAGAGACQTAVTVVDEEAPSVTCDEVLRVARATPDDAWPEPPVGQAEDVCDPDSVTVEVAPTVITEPVTEVTTTAADGSGNSASCSTRVEVYDLFAPADLRLLSAQLAGGDTSVSLGWVPPSAEDVTEVRIQWSASPDGPWETVATADDDAQLTRIDDAAGGWYRALSAHEELEGGATEPLRVHAITEDAYRVDGVRVNRVPFSTTLYGLVRAPADLEGGPYPLVLLLHGNHGNCRRDGTVDDYCATLRTHDCNYDGYSAAPNADGMVFQAETLAAHGFIAATLSANALNCRGGYILERTELLLEHLRAWKRWNDGESGPMGTTFAGRLDLSRVGMVGHSRGGDAVSHVPNALSNTPIEGVEVSSIFAIAPTDYNDATVFDASYAVLLPACDGDVSNLWGSDIYERSTEGVWHKSQVFMTGANHNFYNTEWAYDDGRRACPARALTGRATQEAMLDTTLGSWMRRTLDGDRPEAWQRAEAPAPGPVVAYAPRPMDLRWSYTEDGETLLEAYADDPDQNSLGGTGTRDGFLTSTPCEHTSCSGAFLHRTTALRTDWEAASAPRLTTTIPGADTASWDSVSFRMVSRVAGANSGRSDQPYEVVVIDSAGEEARVGPEDLVPIPHAYVAGDVREVMQTIRVPFAAFEAVNPSLDPSRIATISVELGTDGDAGAVTLTDLALGF